MLPVVDLNLKSVGCFADVLRIQSMFLDPLRRCLGSQLQANGHFQWKAVLIHLLIYLQVTCFISHNKICGRFPLSSTQL